MKTRVVIAWLSILTVSGILDAADLDWGDTNSTTGIQGGAGNRDRTETNQPTGDGGPRHAWNHFTKSADTAPLPPPGSAVSITKPDPPSASPDPHSHASDEPTIGPTPQSPAIDEPLDSGAPFEPSPIPGTGGPLEDQEPLPDYQTWETANGITGAGAAADSDGDGIPNGVEFVIGGDPSAPDSDSNSLLPTVTVDNDCMNFVFRRTDVAAGCNPFVEYSNSLAQWAPADPGVDGVFIDEAGDFFEPGVARVTVRIPRSLASASTLFARLRVDITP